MSRWSQGCTEQQQGTLTAEQKCRDLAPGDRARVQVDAVDVGARVHLDSHTPARSSGRALKRSTKFGNRATAFASSAPSDLLAIDSEGGFPCKGRRHVRCRQRCRASCLIRHCRGTSGLLLLLTSQTPSPRLALRHRCSASLFPVSLLGHPGVTRAVWLSAHFFAQRTPFSSAAVFLLRPLWLGSS